MRMCVRVRMCVRMCVCVVCVCVCVCVCGRVCGRHCSNLFGCINGNLELAREANANWPCRDYDCHP